MSLLYLALAVFFLFAARVPEFDMLTLPQQLQKCTLRQFWDYSFELAEHFKPQIQRRHLFADLTISHPWPPQKNHRRRIQHWRGSPSCGHIKKFCSHSWKVQVFLVLKDVHFKKKIFKKWTNMVGFIAEVWYIDFVKKNYPPILLSKVCVLQTNWRREDNMVKRVTILHFLKHYEGTVKKNC